MDIARCTLDGITYYIQGFAQLDNLLELRRNLVCIECEGPAYFRGVAINGQAACFGARHSDDCELAAADHEPTEVGVGADNEPTIENTAERILVDFTFGAQTINLNAVETYDDGNNARQVHHRGNLAQQRTRITRRPSSFLRYLVLLATYRDSTQIIEVDGHGEQTVRNFFCNFSDINDTHRDQFKGYWGMVTDVSFDAIGMWLNSGGRTNVSVLYPSTSDMNAVRQRYRFENHEELAGSYYLIFGNLKISARGKKYILLEDLDKTAIRLT